MGLKSKHKIHLSFVYILYIQPKGNLLHSILHLAFDCNLFLEIRYGTFHLWYGDFGFSDCSFIVQKLLIEFYIY